MTQEISIQRIVDDAKIPDDQSFETWIQAAIIKATDELEVCLRIIDEKEMQALNKDFRGKNKPTNVLSFPYADEFDSENSIHGDIIICASVVEQEAKEQDKSLIAHWAHLIVHGCLHIQGFDHENDQDAEIMEQHEIDILKHLGFANPYSKTSITEQSSQ